MFAIQCVREIGYCFEINQYYLRERPDFTYQAVSLSRLVKSQFFCNVFPNIFKGRESTVILCITDFPLRRGTGYQTSNKEKSIN